MQGSHFTIPLFIPGTLTANAPLQFQAPFPFIIEKVSAACDASTSFILDIGTAADPDAYLDGKTVTGAADTSTMYDEDDFVNAQHPHVPAGTEVTLDIDYDGGAGTDAANVTVILFCCEG